MNVWRKDPVPSQGAETPFDLSVMEFLASDPVMEAFHGIAESLGDPIQARLEAAVVESQREIFALFAGVVAHQDDYDPDEDGPNPNPAEHFRFWRQALLIQIATIAKLSMEEMEFFTNTVERFLAVRNALEKGSHALNEYAS